MKRAAVLISAGILLSTVACNKNGFKAVRQESSDLFSIDQTPDTPADLGAEFGSADMSGNIRAFQDLRFRFKVPGAGAGKDIATENLPAWLSVDLAAGEIRGVPSTIETTADFRLTVDGEQKGPYRIHIIGDPIKQYQWHLKNIGQKSFAATAGVAGQDIHLDQTIADRILGQNIRVAVSDSGVSESHRGLKENIIPGRNYLNDFAKTKSWSGSATPDETVAEYSHGTGVAGLIAERGWLGIGGRGVAPLAKIAGFLFVPAQEKLLAAGLFTAAHVDQYQGDFDVFNYSWGDGQCALTEYGTVLRDRMRLSAKEGRGGKGAIMVKASGNEFFGALTSCYTTAPPTAIYFGNSNFSEDSASPYMISVAAIGADGISSSYSSPGANLWVTAPGGEYGLKVSPTNQTKHLEPAIVTTDFTGQNRGNKTLTAMYNDFNAGASPNQTFEHTATFNGTSSAAPIVSGAIALMLSANPALTWRDVRHILASTSDQVDTSRTAYEHPQTGGGLAGHQYEQAWVTNAAGFKFHNWYGFGRINVDRAVAMAKSYAVDLGTFKETNSGNTWKYDSGTLNMAVPPASATGVTSTLNVAENYKIESVEIRLSAAQCIGALGVELTSPSGTKSILMNINSGLVDSEIESHIFVSNAFYNENSAGTWTLKLIGARAACTTQFRNWQLNVLGH